jgi:UDP-4-amino-4,6-dideoxy-N-acetyl-beta-L-altrosamine N-acetyltransferase
MHLKLINLIKVTKPDQLKLLEIRNEPNIRHNMFNKKVISPKQHLEWINELSNSEINKVFCVYGNDAIIGSIGYSLIESCEKSCSWFFYLSEKSRDIGLAPCLEFSFLDYLFNEQKIKIIFADVVVENQLIFNLHKKFGFETSSQHKNCDNSSIEFIRIKLSKETWNDKRVSLNKKLSAFFDKFTLEILEN